MRPHVSRVSVTYLTVIRKSVPQLYMLKTKHRDADLFDILFLNNPHTIQAHKCYSLLQLLLGAQVVGVSTLLLAAVNSTRVKARVTSEDRVLRSQNCINKTLEHIKLYIKGL